MLGNRASRRVLVPFGEEFNVPSGVSRIIFTAGVGRVIQD